MELEFCKELIINLKAPRFLLLEQEVRFPFPLQIPGKAHASAHRQ